MTGCLGSPTYPIKYLLTLRLMALCPNVEIIFLNNMAQLLDWHVCFQLKWRVTIMIHCHYSSIIIVYRLRWSWIIPRKNLAMTFVRSYVRLTAIRKSSNPTHLGSQPLRKKSVDLRVSDIERWLRHSLQSYCGAIVLIWKTLSYLSLPMTINNLMERCLKLLWKGTLKALVPYVNMNGMNGLCIMTQLGNS